MLLRKPRLAGRGFRFCLRFTIISRFRALSMLPDPTFCVEMKKGRGYLVEATLSRFLYTISARAVGR